MKITIIYRYCIIFFMVHGLLINQSMANNIVLNGGFEATKGSPGNWIIIGPVPSMQPLTVVDSRSWFSGSQALKMESTNPNCHGRAVQSVDITGGTDLSFQCSLFYKESGFYRQVGHR